MDKDNILAVNVPNAISILIMAMAGGLILSLIRKTLKAKIGGANALASDQGASPASGMVVG